MKKQFREELDQKISDIIDFYVDHTASDQLTVRVELTKMDGITSVSSRAYTGLINHEVYPKSFLEDPSNKNKKPRSFKEVLDLINNHISG
ncbi:hypothetical protein ACFSW8_10850 [Rubritalea tangerina]|uniref:Phage protein n=1 Tax=Rubritalea tangerina TaxID=430798 RepID=A0ABW4ZBZ1_9BACT